MSKAIVVFGSACQHLHTAKKWISDWYDVLTLETKRFKDGEFWVKYPGSIRKKDVFIIQSTNQPDSNLMELLIMIDAAKRASANSITAVIPYFGYARQDRKDQSRVAITASLVAHLIEEAGATRVITMDLHTPQIQGFFKIPVDNLEASPLLIEGIHKKSIPTMVAPDVGREKDVLKYANRMGYKVGLLSKTKTADGDVSHVLSYGNIENQAIILFDDMITSASTLKSACILLQELHAESINIAATHLISDKALGAFGYLHQYCDITLGNIHVTNTIKTPMIMKYNVTVHDISDLLSETIEHVFRGESISNLF